MNRWFSFALCLWMTSCDSPVSQESSKNEPIKEDSTENKETPPVVVDPVNSGPVISNPVEPEEVEDETIFRVSSTKWFSFPNLSLDVLPFLTTERDENGEETYDREMNQGRLIFLSQTRKKGDWQSVIKSMPSLDSKAYLFARVDQRNLPPPYETNEAEIYLHTASGEEIAIGRYKRANDFLPENISADIWAHPIICTKSYASICKVQIDVKEFSTIEEETHHYELSLKISLLTKLDDPVYEAVTSK